MELKVRDGIRDKMKEIDVSALTLLEAPNILQSLKSKGGWFQ
jgi:hypothetical protein